MRKKGFTLIEMIIVIVIIGILAAAILPKILGAKDRANDVKRIADLRNIAMALEMYYMDNGEYPFVKNTCGTLDETLKKDESFKGYMKEIPSDSVKGVSLIEGMTPGEYQYCLFSKNGIKGNGYRLLAKVSNIKSANMSRYLRKNKSIKENINSVEYRQKLITFCSDGIKKGTKNDPCQSGGKSLANDIYYMILSE